MSPLASLLMLALILGGIGSGVALAVMAVRMPRDFPARRILGAVHLAGIAVSILALALGVPA